MADYDPAAPALDAADAGFLDGDYHYNVPADGQNDDDGDDEDYDPSSFNLDGETSAEPATEPAADHPGAAKQKTVGGFIVDDEDEEEDAAPATLPSQVNGIEGAQSGLGAAAVAQAHDVPVASEPSQDHAAQSAGLNGPAQPSVFSASHTPSNVSTTTPSFQPPAPASPSAPADQQGKEEPPPSTTEAAAWAEAATSATAFVSQSVAPTPQPPPATTSTAPQSNGAVPAVPTARLPHDKVGQLEDRIKDDPRADTEAWLSLIAHYRDKSQFEQMRSVYERSLKVFPAAASIWVEYIRFELDQGERPRADVIFGNSLPNTPSLTLWTHYLDYLRRFFPLINDTQGQNRKTIEAGFQAILNEVGSDPEAGGLWREYIDFIKTGEGVIGGAGWKDQQKMDFLRSAYHRAVRLPHSELTKLWKEFDNFEIGINRATGRKNMQEQSPHYMTARSAKTQMDHMLDGLDRTSLPKLPPLYGCEGEDEFATQVEKWRGWIAWEKEDPLVLKEEDLAAYRKRVLFAYRQAVMSMRFYPEMWFEAASWCFGQGNEDYRTEGESLLDRGIEACPESILLSMKKADRIEEGLEGGNSESAQIENANKVEPVYEGVLAALYALNTKTQQRKQNAIQEIKQHFASLSSGGLQPGDAQHDEDDSDKEEDGKPKTRAEQEEAQIRAVSNPYTAHLETLKRTISSVWVAKMRCYRRLQGSGTGKEANPIKGFRGIFTQARARGCLTSQVYIASAQLELHASRDSGVARRVFERGMKLFPTDEVYALEYMRYLHDREGDSVNALGVFEQCVSKIANATEKVVPGGEEEKKAKVRPLYWYMHGWESANGDLRQIRKLESRMRENFSDESEVGLFGSRYALPQFDSMAVQLIISPTQARPARAMAAYSQTAVPMQLQGSSTNSIEPLGRDQSPAASHIRLGPNGPYVASPKRPLEDADSDVDTSPRKFQRAESPFKGTAGRRVATHSAQPSISGMPGAGAGGFAVKNFQPGGTAAPPGYTGPALPPPLPKAVTDLLAVIPGAGYYHATKLEPANVVDLLRRIDPNAAKMRLGL